MIIGAFRYLTREVHGTNYFSRIFTDGVYVVRGVNLRPNSRLKHSPPWGYINSLWLVVCDDICSCFTGKSVELLFNKVISSSATFSDWVRVRSFLQLMTSVRNKVKLSKVHVQQFRHWYDMLLITSLINRFNGVISL